MNKLKQYIKDILEVYPDDDELDAIIRIVLNEDAMQANVGINANRIKHNPREKAFAEEWAKENEPRAGLNYGQGILQDLFMERVGDVLPRTVTREVISHRDRMIVATVIQWLGSNCGMAFLSEALRRFGADIKHPDSK